MTTTTWKVSSGNWSLSGSWSAGAPGTADTALIKDATVVLFGGTMQAALLDANPTNGLTFDLTNVTFNPATTELTGPVTVNANGSLTARGISHVGTGTTPATLVINVNTSSTNFAPEFTNTGTILLTGGSGSSLGINPASNASPTFANAGVLTIGSGSALDDDGGNINQLNSVFLNIGRLSFLGDGVSPVLTQGNFNDPVVNSGVITVSGGGSLDPKDTFIQFLSGVSGGGSIHLGDATMFEFAGVGGDGTIAFSSDHAVLEVAEATPTANTMGAVLDHFGFTDVIKYIQPIASIQYAGDTSAGTLTVNFPGGASQQLSFTNIPSTDFKLNQISVSDDEIVLACFAAGTRILTGAGEVPVERLRVGDRVVTLRGGRLARIRWIGQRGVVPAQMPRPRDVWPLRIGAGAFGENRPHRTLLLSADHSVHLEGRLVRIHQLANGRTVRSEPVDEITYYHLELERHDVLIADGMPCESYLDTGNRAALVEVATPHPGPPPQGGRENVSAAC